MNLIGMVEETKKIKSAIKHRIAALLIGETGTGKTSVAIEAARELGREVVRVNLNGGVTPDQLLGRYQAKAENGTSVTYFQEGIIPQAMKQGAVLLLDEINAALPDTLFVLHPLLEERPSVFIPETQERIEPVEGFSVIATMNPSHDYAGTKGLNAALFSRFGMVVRFKKLMGSEFLSAMMQHVPGLSAGKAAAICKVVEEADRLRAEEKITTRLTLREAIAAARFCMDGLTLKEAIVGSLIDKLEPYEKELFSKTYEDEPIGPAETVEEIFELALQTKKAQADVERLTAELASVEQLREMLQQLASIAAKPGLSGSVAAQSGKTEDTAAPDLTNVNPWASTKSRIKGKS